MEIKHYIKFDLSRSNTRHTVQVSKGDKRTHKLIFSFCNGSEPVDISTALVAGASVRNSTGCVDDATIIPAENIVEYTPSSLALLEPGIVLCTLTLVDADGSKLYAPSFYLFVNEDYSDNTEKALSEALRGSEAWGIIAKTKDYARKVFDIANGADQRIKNLEDIDLVYDETTRTLKIEDGNGDEMASVDLSLELSRVNSSLAVKESEGLDFYDWKGSGYAVRNKGNCSDTEIVIPEIYNGKPVLFIYSKAFTNDKTVTRIVFPSTIEGVGGALFNDCNQKVIFDFTACTEVPLLNYNLYKKSNENDILGKPNFLDKDLLYILVHEDMKEVFEASEYFTGYAERIVTVPRFYGGVKQFLKTLKTEVTELEESVDTKAEMSVVTALEGTVTTLGGTVTTLDSRVTALEKRKIRFTEDNSIACRKTVPITATGDAQIGRIGGASHVVDFDDYVQYDGYRILNGTLETYTFKLPKYTIESMMEDSIVIVELSTKLYSAVKSITLHGLTKHPFTGDDREFFSYELIKGGNNFKGVFHTTLILPEYELDEGEDTYTEKGQFLFDRLELTISEYGENNTFIEESCNFKISYVPLTSYHDPIIATKVSKILSKSVNLIPKTMYRDQQNTTRGITYTNNLDGTVTMNGQKYSSADFSQWYIVKNLNITAGKYYIELEGCPDSYRGKIKLRVISAEGDRKVTRDYPYLNFSEQSDVSVRIKVNDDTNFNNVKFTPAFRKDDSVLPIDSLEIPEEILNIEHFGEGNPKNPNECNYLDLDRKEVVISGMLNSSNMWYKYPGAKVYDVSKLLTRDNYIKIIAGGDLEFVSDVAKPVPSDVYYMSYISKTANAEEVTENV